MSTMESAIRENPDLAEHVQSIRGARNFEEVCEVFRKIDPNITDEMVKKEVLTISKDTAEKNGKKLSDDDLSAVAGGFTDFDRFKSSALTALIALSGFAVAEYMLPTSAHAFSDSKVIGVIKKDADTKDIEKLNQELFEAIKKGDRTAVEGLILQGADVNARNQDGTTKLFEVAKSGDEQFVKHLIKYGAFVNIPDNQCKSVVDYIKDICNWQNKSDGYKSRKKTAFNNIYSLLSHVSQEQGDNYLIHAKDAEIRQQDLQKEFKRNTSNIDRVKQLISYGMDVNFRDDKGNTPIFYAIDDENIIKLLIDNGADVNVKNKEGTTPLMARCVHLEKNSVQKVKLLLDAGAKVDEKDVNGEDALYMLISKLDERFRIEATKTVSDGVEIVNLLLERDSSKESKERAFLRAAEIKKLNLIKAFVESKIDLEAKNGDGQTALCIAADKGCVANVEYLLKSGADINATDNFNNTALIYAIVGDSKTLCTDYPNYNELSTVDTNYKWRIACILIERGAKLDIETKQGATALVIALKSNCSDIAKLLIEYGADVNHATKDGVTPLMQCMQCSRCKNDLIKLLTKKGARINQKDKQGNNTLIYAIVGKADTRTMANSDMKIIKDVVEKGAAVDETSDFGDTPLMYATSKNNLEAMKFLIGRGANVNAYNKDGHTPLMRAETPEALELLLKSGANINAVDKEGRNALVLALAWPRDNMLSAKQSGIRYTASRYARSEKVFRNEENQEVRTRIYEKDVKLIKALIDNGADVNAKNSDGQSVYSLAVGRDRYDVVELLKSNKKISAQEKDKADNSKLLLKTLSGDVKDNNTRFEEVQNLLQNDLDINAKDVRGSSALEIAVTKASRCEEKYFEREKEIVKMLLEKGANAKDSLLWTENKELVNLLLSYGADAAAKDVDGRTTLMVASDPEVVKTLIEHGADANAKDNFGNTVLMSIAHKSRNELQKTLQITKTLIENGADVNAKNNNNGKTALMYAIENGARDEFLELLVDSGADVNVADNKGVTAFMYASNKYDGMGALKILLEKGADHNKRDLAGKNALGYAKTQHSSSDVIKLLSDLYSYE